MRPFSRNLVHYNWHWFWDYGNGELGNNGIHYIDLARWGLNRQLPSYVSSNGGRFGYRDQAETPNTQLTTYRFEDGTELIAETRGRFSNAEGDVTSGLMFYGSKGYFDAVRANRRELLAAEIEQTFLSSVYCLLGNISYRTRRELHFDPRSARFTNDSEANELLKAPYRPPFVVPDIV